MANVFVERYRLPGGYDRNERKQKSGNYRAAVERVDVLPTTRMSAVFEENSA
jgi:hypothetical protein